MTIDETTCNLKKRIDNTSWYSRTESAGGYQSRGIELYSLNEKTDRPEAAPENMISVNDGQNMHHP